LPLVRPYAVRVSAHVHVGLPSWMSTAGLDYNALPNGISPGGKTFATFQSNRAFRLIWFKIVGL
jgi:hypothetical protein